MNKTPTEILLKLIENSEKIVSDGNLGFQIFTEKGCYRLYFIDDSKISDDKHYTLIKDMPFGDHLPSGLIFKYELISNEIIFKHLNGNPPKQELINEIFE
jgi:hypothetical protein